MKRPYLGLLLLLLVGAAAWFGWIRFRPPPATTVTRHNNPAMDLSGTPPVVKPLAPPVAVTAPVDLTKHDRQTIDFSSGQPVVKDAPEDRAVIDQAVREMAEAAQSVTFAAPKKKTEPPVPPKN